MSELLRINDLNLISEKQLIQLAKEVSIVIKPLNNEEIERNLKSNENKKRKKKRKRFCYSNNKRQKEENNNNKSLYWAQSLINCRLNREFELLFEVKWFGYSSSSNTWQSIRDLFECDLLFQDFYSKQLLKLKEDNNEEEEEYSRNQLILLSRVITELGSECCDKAIISRLEQQFEDKKNLKLLLNNWSLALRRAKRSKSNESNVFYEKILFKQSLIDLKILKTFQKFNNFIEFWRKRKETKIQLNEWKLNFNKEMNGKEKQIEVENDFDFQVLPKLQFLDKYCFKDENLSSKLSLKLPEVECNCDENCRRNQCVCALLLYKDNKRFKTSRVVYECNDKCLCSPLLCPNRRIQRGRDTELTVFRTKDGRGWGLKTQKRLNFGDFVMEYVGEVIDSRETKHIKDSEYLFSIDSEFCGQTLFINGKYCGNVTRFANHSCQPNLDVHLAFVSGKDLIPRIAFFANRRIEANEELSYDYKRNLLKKDEKTGEFVRQEDNDEGYDSRDSNEPQEEAIPCLCGANKCKKWL